jgi:hypothetical protein
MLLKPEEPMDTRSGSILMGALLVYTKVGPIEAHQGTIRREPIDAR